MWQVHTFNCSHRYFELTSVLYIGNQLLIIFSKSLHFALKSQVNLVL